MLVSCNGISQLLSVATIPSSSGNAQANAVLETLQQWNITHAVQGSGAPKSGGLGGGNPPFRNQTLVFKVKCPNCASCSTCCYFKTALTEFAPHHAEAKSASWCSGKRHCFQCEHGQIQGEMHPSHQPFSNMFLMNTVFSIILNLFDNNEPYTLSTHNRKCLNKMHHIW